MEDVIKESGDGSVAVFHRIYAHENFEESAKILMRIARLAQEQLPGKKRVLFLIIEGHRNSAGGFDLDMYDLQTQFVMKYLMPFLTEAHIPLGVYQNKNPQRDDVPNGVVVRNVEEDES